jgi:hypothetical protein
MIASGDRVPVIHPSAWKGDSQKFAPDFLLGTWESGQSPSPAD